MSGRLVRGSSSSSSSDALRVHEQTSVVNVVQALAPYAVPAGVVVLGGIVAIKWTLDAAALLSPLLMVALAGYAALRGVRASSWLPGMLNQTVVAPAAAATGEHIHDRFESLDDLQAALRACGLESSNLIYGVDFTASNAQQGQRTFGKRSLHALDAGEPNPYQRVIAAVHRTLGSYDEDGQIPMYGFGDVLTTDMGVFDMHTHQRRRAAAAADTSIEALLGAYERTVRSVKLSGPTSFAPLIERAVAIVRDTRRYHILVIITDGQPTDAARDAEAIRAAADVALSIVCVGVGDGPFDTMDAFDDDIAGRRFDNFQFVDWAKVSRYADQAVSDDAFALAALQEIPAQHTAIMALRLLAR